MNRILHILIIVLFFTSCNQPQQVDKPYEDLDTKVQELMEKYKPGLGDYMLTIQLHHSKLWFAGINNNWKLASYEIDEIKESFQSIKNVQSDRPEVKTVGMIENPLEDLTKAIAKKDEKEFKKSFETLTTTCNNCHKTNGYTFNVITIPTALPVSNQDFKSHEK